MLGKVIGDCLRQLGGLNAVYLPSGVSLSIAHGIVEQANAENSDAQFAILVVPRGSHEGLSTSEALKYRQGNRLAVVAGRHPDLGSFTQSFREVLGLNYPEVAGGHVTLSLIAQAAVRLLLVQAGIPSSRLEDPTQAESFVEAAMKRVSDLQAELREGSEPWNVQWFRQTDIGLERLGELLVAEVTDSANLDDFFTRYTFAAFGLPRPRTGTTSNYTYKQLAEAFKTHWNDEASIVSAIGHLAHSSDASQPSPHSLATVNWAHFDRELAVSDNRPLTFARYYERDNRLSLCLAELTDPEFVNPTSQVDAFNCLRVFTAGGEPVSILGTEATKGPFLGVGKLSEWEGTGVSEELVIRIPTLISVRPEELNLTEICLYSSTVNAIWEGTLEVSEIGDLQCRGYLRWEFGETPWKVEPRAATIKLRIGSQDILMSRINRAASCDIHMVYPEIGGLWIVPMRGSIAKPSVGKPSYCGPSEFPGKFGEIDLESVELDSTVKRHKFIVWTDAQLPPQVDGQLMQALHGRANIYCVERASTPLVQIDIGNQSIECRSMDSSSAPRSPIVAAITKSVHSNDPLDLKTARSLRGTYENWVASDSDGEILSRSLGHVVLPSDREMPAFPVQIHEQSGFAMPDDLESHWNLVSDQEIPLELLSSVEADEFRAAFQNLDLEGRLFKGGEESELPTSLLSTTSWKDLWETDAALERYLDAYVDLIQVAKRIGNPVGQFWASYPFSISIWSTENTARCEAVLLSPLHPIRLAWLAGVEHTLWNSKLASHLAGTVEGWNFPVVGPRETEMGRLMAVPAETGDDQVFLGWSMLVQASVEQHDALSSPEKAGALRAPGTSVSGLNATAVVAAMRSYRRMNPQVTTLTVDMAASGKATRLAEVDEALLDEISDWSTKGKIRLFGGARVWDSINRAGEPPTEKIGRLVRTTQGVPLTWSRYSPKNQLSMRCNVRILQDGGVNVMLKNAGQAPRLGLVGSIPLRRFEAVSGQTIKNNTAFSSPTLNEQQGWRPFTSALTSLEGSVGTTQIATKLFAAHLTSDSADWTVSGESLMNPSSMAAIVQKAGKQNQMLWEWRPPFLEAGSGVPALERRPFVSIARVPNGFKKQLERLLERATGKPASEDLIQLLLGRLGTRGVGLSSMLAMGGTHAAGALGFYLVFSMMDAISGPDDHTYVLPIDACDSFMRALAPDQVQVDSKRRADVLILRIADDTITLAPVEIKFYGLDSAVEGGRLPEKISDSLLTEPLDQVQKSLEVLNNIHAAWMDIKEAGNPSDRYLWANGMAALVESAIRLAPSSVSEPVELGKALGSLIEGKSNIVIGRPLIAYFKHKAVDSNGSRSVKRTFESGPTAEKVGSFGLLAANSEAAFDGLDNDGSAMTAAWGELVEWALTSPVAIHELSDDGEQSETKTSVVDSEVHSPVQNHPDEPPSQETGQLIEQNPRVREDESPNSRAASGSEAPEFDVSRVSVEVEKDDAPGNPNESKEEKRESSNTEGATCAVLDAEPAPVDPGGVRFPVGTILSDGATAEFWPSNTNLNQLNLGIVGDLGTGKTQLLKSLIFQLRAGSRSGQEKPLSMLIFDYKRDFQDEDFLKAVGGQVLRIHRIPLNFFGLRDGYTAMGATQRANEFIDVLDKIYGGIGPVQKDRLQVTITDLYREKIGEPPTLESILERYNEGGTKADAVTSLLRKFVTAEVFSEDPGEIQNFDELMDDKVVVVALNDFGTDDDGKNALVVLFLNLYYDYMMHAKKWPFRGSDPQLRVLNSFLLVDEAINIMKYRFPVLMSLLLQGREFGFGVMLASQYLNHFRQGGEDYAQPLLTWFIHKVPSVTSKDLSALGLSDKTDFLADRISSLPLHHSLYKSLGVPGKFIKEIPFYSLMSDQEKEDG